jgi:pimeloyl-ACP methyl ester carboxylesterase
MMRQVARLVRTVLFAFSAAAGVNAAWARDSALAGTRSVNGMQMYYEIRGAGPPLVLLHGFSGCGRDWAPHIQPLAEHFRVDSVAAHPSDRLRQCQVRGGAQIHDLLSQFQQFKDSYDDMIFTAPTLATISARALIVHGDRDKLFPVDIPVHMYQAIPHSYLWIVPNGGHGPISGGA